MCGIMIRVDGAGLGVKRVGVFFLLLGSPVCLEAEQTELIRGKPFHPAFVVAVHEALCGIDTPWNQESAREREREKRRRRIRRRRRR